MTNSLNQYTTLKKTKETVPIIGQVSNSVVRVDVNGIEAPIAPDRTFQKDVVLNEGPNSITATAYDSLGRPGEDTISLTLQPKPISFIYDLNGNLTSRVIASPSGDEAISYTYDYENRLISASKSDGNSATYKYDYLGRRIQKNVNGVITNFIYDGNQLIAEYDNLGMLLRKTIFGQNIDEPILMIKANSSRYFYHQDGLGSVVDITDQSATLIQSYTYDVFGNITYTKDPSFIQPFTFTGREFDTETGLYYYRARYYDPKLGRFLSADPVGYYAGINLYSYCGNNPINWTDPSGMVRKRLQKAREAMEEKFQKARDAMEQIFKDFTDWLVPSAEAGMIDNIKAAAEKMAGDLISPIPMDPLSSDAPDYYRDFMKGMNQVGKDQQDYNRDPDGGYYPFPEAPKRPYKE